MNQSECQQVIDELDAVINDTRELMKRFEATGMDEAMPSDYQQLHDVYTKAVKDQWSYTQEMLRTPW